VAETKRPRVNRALLVVLGCMLCQMGAGFFYAKSALSSEIIADLGWTRTMWASGIAPMLLISSVSQAFAGAACVRFGVRPVIFASLICMAVAVLIFGSMRTLTHFYVAMMLLALANAGIGDVSIGSVITKWFERRRSLALGFAMVGSNLGSIVYLSAMAQVLEVSTWRVAALSVGLVAVAVILPVAFLFVREPRPDEGAQVEVEETPEASRTVSMPLAEVVQTSTFWVLFYSLFCYALVQIGLVDQFILYLTDLGYTEKEAFAALQLAVGAGIAAKLGAGAIGQVVPIRTAYLLNTGLLTISLVLVPFAANGIVLMLFSICFGLSTASRDVFPPLAVADAFGTRHFAQIFGVMMLAFIPGGMLGPLALAEAHRLFGHYRPGFMACIVLTSVAFISLAVLRRRGSGHGIAC
jgi:OFA family oxalate/formate antiporter-like MFS transporter